MWCAVLSALIGLKLDPEAPEEAESNEAWDALDMAVPCNKATGWVFTRFFYFGDSSLGSYRLPFKGETAFSFFFFGCGFVEWGAGC